ncbi:hypothetical protein [Geothrix sp.]|jgi:hypothetical protein|uniref:hypothetical protein n=1 Tax=Geothrix sp. TaxID=1962974 RepID=UPI0025BB07D9|nr:hypothetical protein [Geothrix sp.]
MDIPQVPTDNLYKFKAIVGVVIVAIVLGFTVTRMIDVELQTIEVETQIQKNEINSRQLVKEIERFERKSINTAEEINSLDQKRVQLAERNAETRGNLNKARFHLRNIYGLLILAVVGSVIGYRMAKVGFQEWLIHVQQPQDALLALQVKVLEKEIPNQSQLADS